MQGRQLELGVPRTTEADLRRPPEGEPSDGDLEEREDRASGVEYVYEHIQKFWEGRDDVEAPVKRRGTTGS